MPMLETIPYRMPKVYTRFVAVKKVRCSKAILQVNIQQSLRIIEKPLR